MLKKDLENRITELENANKQLKKELTETKTKHTKEIEKLKKSEDDKQYQLWKTNNEKYLKRLIKELFKSEYINFQFNDTYYGNFNMSVIVGNEYINNIDGHINDNSNPLDD